MTSSARARIDGSRTVPLLVKPADIVSDPLGLTICNVAKGSLIVIELTVIELTVIVLVTETV